MQMPQLITFVLPVSSVLFWALMLVMPCRCDDLVPPVDVASKSDAIVTSLITTDSGYAFEPASIILSPLQVQA